MLDLFRINNIAPLRLAKAFADSVAKSDRKLIAFQFSQMGSIGDNKSGGYYAYRASNAALNMTARPAVQASRHSRKGSLQWQITVRNDVQRLFNGALPTLIQWGKRDDEDPMRLHPRNSLPRSGVSLSGISITQPSADKLQAAYEALGLTGIAIGMAQAISQRHCALQRESLSCGVRG
jgi:hypothetical protein